MRGGVNKDDLIVVGFGSFERIFELGGKNSGNWGRGFASCGTPDRRGAPLRIGINDGCLIACLFCGNC